MERRTWTDIENRRDQAVELFHEHCLSPKQVARTLGVSVDIVYDDLRYRNAMPRYGMRGDFRDLSPIQVDAIRLARFLGVPVFMVAESFGISIRTVHYCTRGDVCESAKSGATPNLHEPTVGYGVGP